MLRYAPDENLGPGGSVPMLGERLVWVLLVVPNGPRIGVAQGIHPQEKGVSDVRRRDDGPPRPVPSLGERLLPRGIETDSPQTRWRRSTMIEVAPIRKRRQRHDLPRMTVPVLDERLDRGANQTPTPSPY